MTACDDKGIFNLIFIFNQADSDFFSGLYSFTVLRNFKYSRRLCEAGDDTRAARNRNGKEFTVSGEGLLARAFCHEIDHLSGKLFTDDVVKILTDEEVKERIG